tara:strand:+ start:121 stop:1002 length:882 start_codon:yes stop_codon:yes gene_type:complete
LAEVQKRKAEREEKRAKLLGMMKRGEAYNSGTTDQQRRSSTGIDNSKRVIGASSRLYPGPGKRQLSTAMLEQQRKDREQNERLAALTSFPEVPRNKVALQPTVATLMMPVSLMAQRNMGRNMQRTIAHMGRGGGGGGSGSGMPMLNMNNNHRFLQSTTGGLGGSAIRSMGLGAKQHQQHQQYQQYQQHHQHHQHSQHSQHPQYQVQPSMPQQQRHQHQHQHQQHSSAHQRQHSVQSHYNSTYLQPQQQYQQQQQQQQQQQSTFSAQYYARSQFYYQKQQHQQPKNPQQVWRPH